MNLKTFFKIIILSFYSTKLYQTVGLNWKNWGLGFLIRFSIFVAFFSSLVFFIIISLINIQNDKIIELVNLIPEIKITEGRAEYVDSTLKSPIYVGKEKFLVIDLDSKTAEKYPDATIVFSAYSIKLNLLESSNFDIAYNYLLEKTDQKLITPESLILFLDNCKKTALITIAIIGIPLGSLIYFVITLLKAAFYSSIASIFTEIFKLNIKFKSLTRLAIIANTPTFIISNILIILLGSNTAISNQWIVTVIYITYFLSAIAFCLKLEKSPH